MNTADREKARTLELLEAIDRQSNVTQRSLADRLGVALGLANSYLKRCARKGWIKIQQVPPNRYLYYLTPKGFSEKSRLTAQYLKDSLDVYRRASDAYAAIYRDCVAAGRRRIVLCGASELAEIACVRAPEFGVTIVGVFDPDWKRSGFLQLPTWSEFDQVAACDALVLTALRRPEDLSLHLARVNTDGPPLLIPGFLSFVRPASSDGPDGAGAGQAPGPGRHTA